MRQLRRLSKRVRLWLTASIRRQLILGVALVHALLMSLFVFDLVARQQEFLHQESHKQARSMAKTLATNSVSWVLANDVAGLEEVLRSQANHPQLDYAMIVAPDGRVLGHLNNTRVGRYLSDKVSRQLLTGPPAFRVLVDTPRLLDVAAPVFANGKYIAWARIGLYRGGVTEQLQRVRNEGLLYAAAAILFGVLFAALLSRRITTGLNELFGVASAICMGKRDQRVATLRHDEIGNLGIAMNLMLDTIEVEERQRSETQLQLDEAETRVRLLLDSTAEGIIGVDLEGFVTFANRAAVERLGYRKEWELLGREIHGVINLELAHQDGLEMAASYGAGVSLHRNDALFQCRGGESFHAEYWAAPTWSEGAVIGAVLTFIDITRRRETEEELRLYREQLEERVAERTAELTALNRELEAFSYSVSHDLRAPLRSIHGFSKMLEEKYQEQLDATGKDYLQRVMRASNRMSELIDGLLLLSRVSRGELVLESVDVAELAQVTMHHCLESRDASRVRFHVAEMPPARADRKLLTVVLDNLLSNALKFSGMRQEACIEVGAGDYQGRFAYYVRDNGVGFDMRYVDRLFGAFQRLHSMEAFEGTGIGLATVQRIVHRHGGEVWAEAEPERGATFYFTLGAGATNDE